jgi:lysozyme
VAGETEVEITPVAPPADTAVAALVLTPLDDTAQPDPARPLWGPEQRAGLDAPLPADSLFGEDLSLTRDGGPLLRHEVEPEAAARFDWSETGAFIIMGAVGLTAFGASMAAFRLASEQSNGGTETTMIAWVLAIIGGACVGVSSFNLYRRWGLPGGD